MNWETILITFGLMIVGYSIGSILNSVWITKFLEIDDVRSLGSKSAGATNTRRIHGKFVGIIVFILDILKPIYAMAIANIIAGDKVIVQAVGISVVIGHIFPLLSNFKGGKGASCMLGFMITINWTLFFVGALFFLAIVIPTKKVSLGSIIAPIIILIVYICFSQINNYNSITFEPLTHAHSYWINVISLAIIIVFVVTAHRENIKRLIKKEENLMKFSK